LEELGWASGDLLAFPVWISGPPFEVFSFLKSNFEK
jgi:hypothetical protein